MRAVRGKSGANEKRVGTPLAPRASVVAAIRRVMRPLVRMLVSQGITYPFFTDMLKSIFVETASGEFTLDGKRPTDSRLTLLTGVHRKDIRRLLREPLALPRTPSQGGDQSFAALVESVSTNVRPRSVLDELLRLGVVEVDANDYVHLVTSGFVPGKELDAKSFYFGESLHDHLAAGVHNLEDAGRRFLERSVYYDELSPEAVEALRAQSEKLSMEVLKEINKRGMALEREDPPAPGKRMRMRLGVYFFSEPVPPRAAAAPEATKPAKPKPRSRR